TVSGNHLFNGTTNDDTYIYNAGDGHDTINESGGSDTILFGTSVTPANVYLQTDNSNNLFLRFWNSTAWIKVTSNFSSTAHAVETRGFVSAGTTLHLNHPTFTWVSTGTNDALTGSATGKNVFETAVSGTHLYTGTTSDDTYVYNHGDGQITINEFGGSDKVVF